MQYLSTLTPVLSAVLVATILDILLRLLPQARDRMLPLLGVPAALAQSLNRKLNRSERGKNTRYNRGVITLGIMMAAGLLLGGFFQLVVRMNSALEPLIWFICFRLTFPWTAGVELLKAWTNKPNKQDVAKGLAIIERRQVPVLVPSSNPDRHAIARMMIEAAAVSLHRGWFSPILWGVAAKFAGFPPVLVMVLIVTLLEAERVIVTQESKHTPFTAGFELIEAIINFIPARVAALFWALGAFFTPGAKPLAAIRSMFVQSTTHRAINSGWSVAAVAGALNVALHGGKTRDGWVGGKNATARADINDIRRVIFLHAVTLALGALVLTALLMLSIGA